MIFARHSGRLDFRRRIAPRTVTGAVFLALLTCVLLAADSAKQAASHRGQPTVAVRVRVRHLLRRNAVGILLSGAGFGIPLSDIGGKG
jgi:hypothetical protein